MPDIPTEVFDQILRHLPVSDLPPLRRVCKAWREIISDYPPLQMSNKHLLFRGYKGKLHSIPLTSLCFSDDETIVATHVRTFLRIGVPMLPGLPVPSCHGLILIWSFKFLKDWAIWNPFTKECVRIPRFDHLMSRPRGRVPSGGIGYDRVSNVYKVVRVSQAYNRDLDIRDLETFIYSLKSKRWRKIANYANCMVDQMMPFGVFANGAINWIMWVKSPGGRFVEERIITLDLSSESYRKLPMPLKDKYPATRLDSLNECLLLSYSYAEKFDFWIMKGYDGERTWMKFFSLDKVYDLIYYSCPRIVAYVECIKHALIWDEGKFIWFDVDNKCGKTIMIDGLDCTSFQAFAASECSPTDGTFKRKRKSSNARFLRVKLTTTDVSLRPCTSEYG